MGLADFQCEFRTVSGKGGSFIVHGLSLAEITPLLRHHFPDIDALWSLADQYVGGKAELTGDDLGRLTVALCDQAPAFVAHVIALSTREGGDKVIEVAARLPVTLQVQALIDIIELTFDEVGGIKKALESVAGLLSQKTAKEAVNQNNR